jgi:SAM-dependent methyltransferase
MTERFLTQSHWLGIDFDSLGVDLVQDALPTQDFYAAFYAELHRRYATYEDFPEAWRDQKMACAQALATVMDPESRVLAYGCGSGFVERCLIDYHGFRDLWLFDQVDGYSRYLPAATTRQWSPAANHGQVNTRFFDAVYLVQVLYALADGEVVHMLREVQSWLKPGGRVVSLDTSLNPCENGDLATDRGRQPTSRRIMARAGMVWQFFSSRIHRDPNPSALQGWGWQRDNDSVANLFRSAGLSEVRHAAAAHQAVTEGRRQDTLAPIAPDRPL